MAFSSAQWTIPELCVWIVTRSRSAVNALAPHVRESLKYAEMTHGGAYAARALVIEAAQEGVITVTCADEREHRWSTPPRMTLPAEFWSNAEIEDRGHYEAPGAYWCVAKRLDQPTGAKAFSDLLVESAQAKSRWQAGDAGEYRAELSAAAVGDGAEHEGGSTDTRRSGSQAGKASQAEHDEWMKARVKKLLAAGGQSNSPEDEVAARADPPDGLGTRNVRERVRKARKSYAPTNWQKTDVRRQK